MPSLLRLASLLALAAFVSGVALPETEADDAMVTINDAPPAPTTAAEEDAPFTIQSTAPEPTDAEEGSFTIQSGEPDAPTQVIYNVGEPAPTLNNVNADEPTGSATISEPSESAFPTVIDQPIPDAQAQTDSFVYPVVYQTAPPAVSTFTDAEPVSALTLADSDATTSQSFVPTLVPSSNIDNSGEPTSLISLEGAPLVSVVSISDDQPVLTTIENSAPPPSTVFEPVFTAVTAVPVVVGAGPITFSTAAISVPSSFPRISGCRADNALRALRNKKNYASAVGYCSALAGGTSGLTPPSFIVNYGPTRIASACSCLVAAAVPT